MFKKREHSEESKKKMSESKKGIIPWNKGPIYIYICRNCGNEFKRSGSHKYQYCSRECHAESKKGTVPWNKGPVHVYICKNCGKEFKRRKSHEYQYCSMECKAEGQKGITLIDYKCEICGDIFQRKKNKSWKNIRFCSAKCQGEFMKTRVGELSPGWKGGLSYEPYGNEFNEKLKEQIRKRDNYTCQECDAIQEDLEYKLSVHHIDYDKTNNDLNNLISLCKSCHAKTNFSRNDWTKHFRNIMGDEDNDK